MCSRLCPFAGQPVRRSSSGGYSSRLFAAVSACPRLCKGYVVFSLNTSPSHLPKAAITTFAIPWTDALAHPSVPGAITDLAFCGAFLAPFLANNDPPVLTPSVNYSAILNSNNSSWLFPWVTNLQQPAEIAGAPNTPWDYSNIDATGMPTFESPFLRSNYATGKCSV